MKFTVLTFFLLFHFSVVAQSVNDNELFLKKIEHYRKVRGAGYGLTIGGAVLIVAGSFTLANSFEPYNNNKNQHNLGVAGIALGAGCMTAGIPLWIVGSHSRRKYERKVNHPTVGLNVGPYKTGLTVSYKF